MTDAPPPRAAELAAAVAGGLTIALGGLLWLATGLGDLITGRAWPVIQPGTVAEALLRLPSHVTDPRLLWPPRLRPAMPSPAAFYLALALVLATACGVTFFLVRAGLGDRLTDARRRDAAGARWGSGGDLSSLRTRRVFASRRRRQDRGRVGLGYRGRRLLRGEARHALVVFGPPQSGKSAGVAVPALLEWEGPAVASSIKTDLFAASARHRRTVGHVLVFDPYGLAPVTGNTWSPLRLASTWDGALSTAMRMTAAAEIDTSGVRGGSYWTAAAEQRLAPLLYAAASTNAGIAAVVRWAHGQGDAQLPQVLHQLAVDAPDQGQSADAGAAYDAHLAFEALAGETRSSIESTVQMLLRAYRSPRVQASARSCDITPERLLHGQHTLYLIGDSHRSKLLRPIFLALLQELIDHAYHDATLRGGRLKHPLLLCLDELGNVAPLPNLGEVASTAPSHNIQLVSIFHDLAQARSRYGEQAQTVINSHRARMLLPGVADLETLRYFSDLLGERRYRDRSPHHSPGPREHLPLAAPQQLRQIRDGRALLVYGRLPPAELRLRMYYSDRRLRRRVEGTSDDDD